MSSNTWVDFCKFPFADSRPHLNLKFSRNSRRLEMKLTSRVFGVERANEPRLKFCPRSFCFLHWFFNTTGVEKVTEYYRSTGEAYLSISDISNCKKDWENFVGRVANGLAFVPSHKNLLSTQKTNFRQQNLNFENPEILGYAHLCLFPPSEMAGDIEIRDFNVKNKNSWSRTFFEAH